MRPARMWRIILNPGIIFEILAKNQADLLVIEQTIGGFGGLFKLEPQLYAVYAAYEAGGIDQVLRTCGAHVQSIIEIVGPDRLTAVMPHVANILKTLQVK